MKGPSNHECTGCGLFFTGTAAFDKHRTGTYQPNTRRCMSISEMLAAGMVLKDDVWGIPLDEKALASLKRLKVKENA